MAASPVVRPGAARLLHALRWALPLALTLAAYAPVLGGGFVWDDAEHLLKNVVLQERGLYRVWLTAESVVYYPMVWTSYWLEHQLWGLDPRGYHVVNVVLHGANALLVWRVLGALGVPGAWLAGVVFALHPVNVETAAWITQRKNTLCMLFYLIALLSYLRYERATRVPSAWYWGAVAAFALSMLSKSAGVTLPVALLLLAAWRRGRVTRHDLADSLPFFAVAALMSLVEIAFQYGNAMGFQGVRDDSLAARAAGAGWVVWFYLWKAFAPVGLSFVYPRWEIDATDPWAWLPDLALVAAFVLCWRARSGWGRGAGFALAYYVITLAPVLGFLEFYYLKYSYVGDHYQYLAITAPIAWSVGSLAWLVQRREGRLPRVAALVPVVIVVLLFGLTWQRSGRFVDAETLWRDTLAKNRDAGLAHYNYAVLLQEERRLREAASHYREALRIDARAADAHANLGLVLCDLGDCTSGMRHFREALRHAPESIEAHNNLAAALQRAGRPDEALDHYRAALGLDPGNAALHANLGTTLLGLGRADEAREHLRRALAADPTLREARLALARLRRMEGRAQGGAPRAQPGRLRGTTEAPAQDAP